MKTSHAPYPWLKTKPQKPASTGYMYGRRVHGSYRNFLVSASVTTPKVAPIVKGSMEETKKVSFEDPRRPNQEDMGGLIVPGRLLDMGISSDRKSVV